MSEPLGSCQVSAMFNNQLAALAQAMTLARIFTPNATLVLPPVKLGVESLTQFQKGREAGSEPLVFRIAGDLLDVDEIKKVLPVVQFDEFQSTTEGRRLSSSHLCVFDERFPTTPNTSKMIYENTYKLTKIETFDWKIDGNYCIKYDDRYIREAINCGQTKDALLLPKTFGGMTANCTDSFPALRKSLVHLIPRKELRRSVDQLFREIEAPVLGVHIRLINDAVRNCMKTEGGPAIVIKWMQDQFGSLFDQSRSIYVAFNPTDSDLVDIFQDMKNNFGSSKRVISCKDMVNCGHTRAPWAEELNINEYEFIFRNPYSSSLMDMWALASSDEFIGTRGSTFTTNVHRWRKLGTPELRYGGNENDRNYTRKDMCICNCGTTQNVH
uniref:Uncharacterized protein n=1 Tax=Compsopogon caeruleus TaxID=31354 RepID=A0A7S1TBI1_9RHOD|mmetsp:Transcript_15018/g.30526  ORF Transcript_15018/g.30526 Transcript_15018/m.30526 type:complete len:383 (+) Transcript_15018:125-1273(+)